MLPRDGESNGKYMKNDMAAGIRDSGFRGGPDLALVKLS